MPDINLEGNHPRIISANLVEIGSVASEEKFFLKFHPPFFLFLAW
jgi:UV DNA damage repair endonuclease